MFIIIYETFLGVIFVCLVCGLLMLRWCDKVIAGCDKNLAVIDKAAWAFETVGTRNLTDDVAIKYIQDVESFYKAFCVETMKVKNILRVYFCATPWHFYMLEELNACEWDPVKVEKLLGELNATNS